MTSTSIRTSIASPMRLAAGAAGGLVGGVAFGLMMQGWDMLPMVAMLIGSESVAVGWVVHLAIAAFIGITFAVLFGNFAGNVVSSTVIGAGYGLVWWVLGALTLMPAKLGMDLWVIDTMAWRSFFGHIVYGVLLGATYALVARAK